MLKHILPAFIGTTLCLVAAPRHASAEGCQEETCGGLLIKDDDGTLHEANRDKGASIPYLFPALTTKQKIKDITSATMVKMFNRYRWSEIESRRSQFEKPEWTSERRLYRKDGLCGEEGELFPSLYVRKEYVLEQYYEIWTINQTLESYFSWIEWKKVDPPHDPTTGEKWGKGYEGGKTIVATATAAVGGYKAAAALQAGAAPPASGVMAALGSAAGVDAAVVATASSALTIAGAGIAVFVGTSKVYDLLHPDATHKLEQKNWTVAGFVPAVPALSIKTAIKRSSEERVEQYLPDAQWNNERTAFDRDTALLERIGRGARATLETAPQPASRSTVVVTAIKVNGTPVKPYRPMLIASVDLGPGSKTFSRELAKELDARHQFQRERDAKREQQKKRLSWQFVEKPKACPCGISIAAGIGPAHVQSTEHLAPKSFDVTLGENGKPGYFRGRMTVTPGVRCESDGTLGFPVFGGVSREKDYFNLTVYEGSATTIKYMEQWLAQIRVTFDKGAPLTTSDALLSGKAPTGATRITRIEMDFDGGEKSAKATLVWSEEAPSLRNR